VEARRTLSGGTGSKPPSGLGLGLMQGQIQAQMGGDTAGTRYLPSPFDAGSPESETGLSHATSPVVPPSTDRKFSMDQVKKDLPPPPIDADTTGQPGANTGTAAQSADTKAAMNTQAKEEGLGTSKFWTMTRKRLPSFGFGGQGQQAPSPGQVGSPGALTPRSPTSLGATPGAQGTQGRMSAQDMLRRFDI
jgi:hypothetical protein